MVRLVILAGGKAMRMGQDKLALPWKNDTVLGKVVRCAQECIINLRDNAGYYSELYIIAQNPIEAYIGPDSRKTLDELNGKWLLSQGQNLSTNIHLGLDNLSPKIRGVSFLPGDQIGINTSELSSLLLHFLEVQPDILVPYCYDYGSPVIFSTKYVPALKMIQGDMGGKQILKNFPQSIQKYFVSESFLNDLDTPEDYLKLKKDHSNLNS